MSKVKRAYYLTEEVLRMLERMSTDELRTLSNELEVSIMERYRRLYQEQAAQQEPTDA